MNDLQQRRTRQADMFFKLIEEDVRKSIEAKFGAGALELCLQCFMLGADFGELSEEEFMKEIENPN